MAKPHRIHLVLQFDDDKEPNPLYLGDDRGRARDVFNAAEPGPGTASSDVCMYEFPLITRRARLKKADTASDTELPTPAAAIEAPVSEVSPPAPEDAAAPAPKTIKEKLARS